jgi:hypothetical protein
LFGAHLESRGGDKKNEVKNFEPALFWKADSMNLVSRNLGRNLMHRMQFISFSATIILLIQSPLSFGFTYPINSIMAKSSSAPAAAAKKAATKKTTAKKQPAPTKKATTKKSTTAVLSSSTSEAGGGGLGGSSSGKIVTIEACKQ